MITMCRRALKFPLFLGIAVVLGLGAWLAIVLLSQLEQMKAVTAPAVQSLGAVLGPLTGITVDDAAAHAEANYAAARLWVWFCIGANAAGAVLLALWLKAVMVAPAAPPRRKPDAPAAPASSLIVRAMENGARGRSCAPPALGAPSARAGDPAARLARLSRIIDTLAFQTTILAVNAAVEAARAGQLPPQS
ncbi:hypothetical protein IV454_26900 [Massilia antarctica]|uniref:Methyl-accepting transducer domain-containing protein n=1 Tax=Massilia antarctica TaxID=2765360 RepID=A0AA49A762_9BURK|nr:methyl-accepting chemotaxis protein [Massilia antarctica]QPI49068.1 hypothetical protein IV454_26900 [Massilia antarctica]